MMFGSIATPISESAKKPGFLRKNFLFILSWPVAALALGLIGWGTLLGSLDGQRHQAESAALTHTAALTKSYAGQLNRAVEAVDQILLHVRYEWKLSKGQLQLENMKEMGLFPPTSLLNIGITDRNGVFFSGAIQATKGIDVRDRPYFLAQKNATTDTLYIGAPVDSRVSNRVVIPFARRLTDPDGQFSGVAVVAVVPDYFTANYDATTLGENGFFGIVGNDSIIRVTRTGQTVHPIEAPALLSLPRFSSKSGSGLLEGDKWFRDKRSRFVGWGTTAEYPLIALVGLDEQEIMAPYRAKHAVEIRNATWATVALTIFTFIAMALSLRIAWAKHKFESTQFTYRVATESGSEGFYIGRPIYDMNGTCIDCEIIDSNHHGAEMLYQRREELIGKRISSLYEGADPDRLIGWLREATEVGRYENDVAVANESPVAARWVHLTIVRSGNNLAISLRDISDIKAHVDELERQNNTDTLTGLPNRNWLQTYLPKAVKHAADHDAILAILFVDLDRFKAVNDTAGHAAGDELLRHAAARLKDAVRPHDCVVRLGGDEFLVIIEQIAHKVDAAQVADRVLHAFRESFRLSQGVHSVGTSIGISMFPRDGHDADTLLRNADVAMYSVKASGKGAFHFYDQKYYDALRSRLKLESELRDAIALDQFIMYFQPRVELSTGTISSMEALVRWMHPTKGLMEPLDFIPLAEESGLILSLGELVIEKVCSQLAYWAQSGNELVPVSVNVSSRQFNETNIAKIFAASLARHNIDPKLVEIELTESSMMGNSADVAAALSAIRKMGVTLLVDDFGTGYSSLSQLQQLDFDVLKVDRAFTAEVDKTEQGKIFFTAIITMAHALGMRVVAEGVERLEQIKILKSMFCDEIQGFYISKPLPPSETQSSWTKWASPGFPDTLLSTL